MQNLKMSVGEADWPKFCDFAQTLNCRNVSYIKFPATTKTYLSNKIVKEKKAYEFITVIILSRY
jgi:hypothetical protein